MSFVITKASSIYVMSFTCSVIWQLHAAWCTWVS